MLLLLLCRIEALRTFRFREILILSRESERGDTSIEKERMVLLLYSIFYFYHCLRVVVDEVV